MSSDKLTLEEACLRLKENDPQLTKLDLSNTTVGDAGAVAIAFGVKKNTNLVELHLGCSSIGQSGAIRLAQSLKMNYTVQRLYLQGNSIGDKGAEAMAGIFKAANNINGDDDDNDDPSSSLELINLARNNIGDVGASALAQVLSENDSTIKKLYLYENLIGNNGAAALGELIESNFTLQELFVWDNKIGDVGMQTLNNSYETALTLRKNMKKRILLRTSWKIDNGVGGDAVAKRKAAPQRNKSAVVKGVVVNGSAPYLRRSVSTFNIAASKRNENSPTEKMQLECGSSDSQNGDHESRIIGPKSAVVGTVKASDRIQQFDGKKKSALSTGVDKSSTKSNGISSKIQQFNVKVRDGTTPTGTGSHATAGQRIQPLDHATPGDSRKLWSRTASSLSIMPNPKDDDAHESIQKSWPLKGKMPGIVNEPKPPGLSRSSSGGVPGRPSLPAVGAMTALLASSSERATTEQVAGRSSGETAAIAKRRSSLELLRSAIEEDSTKEPIQSDMEEDSTNEPTWKKTSFAEKASPRSSATDRIGFIVETGASSTVKEQKVVTVPSRGFGAAKENAAIKVADSRDVQQPQPNVEQRKPSTRNVVSTVETGTTNSVKSKAEALKPPENEHLEWKRSQKEIAQRRLRNLMQKTKVDVNPNSLPSSTASPHTRTIGMEVDRIKRRRRALSEKQKEASPAGPRTGFEFSSLMAKAQALVDTEEALKSDSIRSSPPPEIEDTINVREKAKALAAKVNASKPQDLSSVKAKPVALTQKECLRAQKKLREEPNHGSEDVDSAQAKARAFAPKGGTAPTGSVSSVENMDDAQRLARKTLLQETVAAKATAHSTTTSQQEELSAFRSTSTTQHSENIPLENADLAKSLSASLANKTTVSNPSVAVEELGSSAGAGSENAASDSFVRATAKNSIRKIQPSNTEPIRTTNSQVTGSEEPCLNVASPVHAELESSTDAALEQQTQNVTCEAMISVPRPTENGGFDPCITPNKGQCLGKIMKEETNEHEFEVQSETLTTSPSSIRKSEIIEDVEDKVDKSREDSGTNELDLKSMIFWETLTSPDVVLKRAIEIKSSSGKDMDLNLDADTNEGRMELESGFNKSTGNDKGFSNDSRGDPNCPSKRQKTDGTGGFQSSCQLWAGTVDTIAEWLVARDEEADEDDKKRGPGPINVQARYTNHNADGCVFDDDAPCDERRANATAVTGISGTDKSMCPTIIHTKAGFPQQATPDSSMMPSWEHGKVERDEPSDEGEIVPRLKESHVTVADARHIQSQKTRGATSELAMEGVDYDDAFFVYSQHSHNKALVSDDESTVDQPFDEATIDQPFDEQRCDEDNTSTLGWEISTSTLDMATITCCSDRGGGVAGNQESGFGDVMHDMMEKNKLVGDTSTTTTTATLSMTGSLVTGSSTTLAKLQSTSHKDVNVVP